jgi:pyruvate ferredoxin oxidoreductase gamma subunit
MRAEVTDPDVVVILDPGLLGIVNITSGLKEDGMLVVNTRSAEDMAPEIRKKWPVAFIDATSIARELLGVPIVNTTMLGALVKVTGIVELESLFGPLQRRFGRLAQKNTNAMQKAFDETAVKETG